MYVFDEVDVVQGSGAEGDNWGSFGACMVEDGGVVRVGSILRDGVVALYLIYHFCLS